MLLKKSSLNIPLLPEREDDRKMASLLCMKLNASKTVTENTDIIRKNILSESSLPTSSFSRSKEIKAIKVLGNSKHNLGIIPKRVQKTDITQESKNITLNSLVSYDSSSNSE